MHALILLAVALFLGLVARVMLNLMDYFAPHCSKQLKNVNSHFT